MVDADRIRMGATGFEHVYEVCRLPNAVAGW